MDNKKKLYSKLPNEIKGFLLINNGWLVGNSINDIINDRKPKDYDVIIPNREDYQDAVKNWSIDKMVINTFGGLKVNINGLVVDFWCKELSEFIINANRITYIYSLKHDILLEKI